ncbi:unnamed protein product [Echinostoma caproni]|uniref:GPI transamidase component PIG-S n=1 Tax=Echinostoma caproni TaxID=27848 RepID=A0A183BDE9_9TREM|nr:unnamed protein product [Echinostoma caproni]
MIALECCTLLKIIRVKHLFLILLAITLALLGLTTFHFKLVPLWALHLNADHITLPGDVLWDLATRDAPSQLASILVVIHKSPSENSSTLVTFRLPNFGPDLRNEESDEGKYHQLRKLTPASHAQLPTTNILSLSTVFWNDSLVSLCEVHLIFSRYKL